MRGRSRPCALPRFQVCPDDGCPARRPRPGNDRNLRRALRPRGVAGTQALFKGQWDLSLPPGGETRPDVPYGADARQSLDLFTCSRDGAPILLFVPGGGFVAGDKAGYRNVGTAFARLGFVTAVMNYRLAPQHPWPSGALDVAAALDWLAGEADALNADATSLYVLAQSAGAAHASAALFDARFQPACLASVRSAALMSGFYRMDAAEAAPNLRASPRSSGNRKRTGRAAETMR